MAKSLNKTDVKITYQLKTMTTSGWNYYYYCYY